MKFTNFAALLAWVGLVPTALSLVALSVLLSPQNNASEVISFRTASVDKSVDAEALLVSHLYLKNRARMIQPSAFASRNDEINWLASKYKLYAVPGDYRSY